MALCMCRISRWRIVQDGQMHIHFYPWGLVRPVLPTWPTVACEHSYESHCCSAWSHTFAACTTRCEFTLWQPAVTLGCEVKALMWRRKIRWVTLQMLIILVHENLSFSYVKYSFGGNVGKMSGWSKKLKQACKSSYKQYIVLYNIRPYM